jgi:hypothetical protein
MNPINTKTKLFLVVLAVVATVWEIVAVAGPIQLITDAMVQLSCERMWIPYFLGVLGGHFFAGRKLKPGSKLIVWFVVVNLAGIAGYELVMWKWPAILDSAISWHCDGRMWVAFVVGIPTGVVGWPRAHFRRGGR